MTADSPLGGTDGIPVAGWRGRALVNTVYSAVGQASSKLATFAWTAVAAHQLSRGDFGAFNFAMSLGLLLVTVAEWGLDTALMQRASREPAATSRFFTQAAGAQGLLALVLFAGAALVSFPTNGGARETALVLILAALFLDTFSDTLRTAAAAMQRQGGVSFALAAGRTAMAAIAIPVLLSGGGLIGLSAAFLASAAIGFVAHLLAVGRIGVRPRLRYLRMREVLAFTRGTMAFGVSALVLAGLFRFDTVLLEWLKGPRAVADYSAAYKLFETVLFLAFAVGGSMFAVLSARGGEPEETAAPLRGGLTAVVTMYLPFALVCLCDGGFVLAKIFGAPYGDTSKTALQWLALAPIAFALSYLMASAITSIGRRRLLLYAATATTVVNVVGDLLVIPRWAGAGAAAMTTLSYFVHAGLLYTLYRRHVHTRLRLLPAIRPAIGGAVVMSAALLAFPAPEVVRIVVGLIGYAAAWALLVRWLEPSMFAAAVAHVRLRTAARRATGDGVR